MSTTVGTKAIWWVEGEGGGYAAKFTLDEALEIAKQDSIDYGCYMSVRRDLHQRPSVIFHTGCKYLPEQPIE